jgi:hypothetical protein
VELTDACADSVAEVEAIGEATFIEFVHLKRRLPRASPAVGNSDTNADRDVR